MALPVQAPALRERLHSLSDGLELCPGAWCQQLVRSDVACLTSGADEVAHQWNQPHRAARDRAVLLIGRKVIPAHLMLSAIFSVPRSLDERLASARDLLGELE